MNFGFDEKKLKSASKILNRSCTAISTELFSLDIYWCRVAAGESWNYSSHRHSFFELHMPLRGEACYGVNGDISVSTGEYLLFAPSTVHQLKNTSADFAEFVFGFDMVSEKIPPLMGKMKEYFKGKASAYLFTALEYMLKNAVNEQVGFADAISHQLACMCIEIFQQIIGNVGAFGDAVTNDMRVKLAIKYIEDNISSEVTPLDVADCVHVSLRHLNRLTQKALSMTVPQLILSRKIRMAKKLLSDPVKSIAEASERTGFSTQQQFSKVFKRLEGITPTQYKKDVGK